MFEPVHGSAPDIAGEGLANPIGALASAALMLEHLGLEEAGRVNGAIEATTGAGLLTPDLGGTSTTREVGDAVLAHLSRRSESS
jgi:tartrate dehydrogenase/decarboxylase/D-malate dehydrogenase